MSRTGDYCSVVGCRNSSKKRSKWMEDLCSELDHAGLKHRDCPCLVPFGFHRFPKNEVERLKWTICLNRSNFTPTNRSVVCSVHFIDGRPTPKNSYPRLALGYQPGKKEKQPEPRKRKSKQPLRKKKEKKEKQPEPRKRKSKQPLRKKKEKKDDKPRQRRCRKMLLTHEEHEKLVSLLALYKSNCARSVSSSVSAAISSSVKTSENKWTATNEPTCSGPEELLIQNIKTEPVEEDEILGPELDNMLDPPVEKGIEDMLEIKLKEEAFDENFGAGFSDPAVEMTFECEEPSVSNSRSLEGTCNFEVKTEMIQD